VSIGTSLSDRQLTSLDKSIITSCTALFALITSPFSSVVADTYGRKRVILLADALFIIGAVAQAVSTTVPTMVAGRSVVGMAIGAASFVVPLYIAELAPARYRGRLVTMNVLFITLGQVVAYVIGWLFAEYGSESTGWRCMVGLGAVPAALQSVMVLFLPESPRWFLRMGQGAQAKAVIEKTLEKSKHREKVAQAILRGIEIELLEEAVSASPGSSHRTSKYLAGWHELFSVRRNRRALTIACLLQGLQQLCGFNSLMYFSATIFTLLGFSVPTLTSLTVAVTNFVCTILAILLIDRVGRRRILICSIPFMVIGLLLAAIGFSGTSFLFTSDSGESSSDTKKPTTSVAVIDLVAIMLYVAAYAIGLGNVPWMQSELFSLQVRSLGSGLATATNWGANFVVGLTFLPLMEFASPSVTFCLYAAVCSCGLYLVWLLYPETAGLSLEETARLLDAPSGLT
jgi:MFS transporter, SP family, solute carrier family 2 (myo-inositol transporter), member 13